MCPPDYLGIRANNHGNEKEQQYLKEFINSPVDFRKKATLQWNELKNIYKSLGFSLIDIPVLENALDQTYTADPAFSIVESDTKKLILVLSQFANINRNKEVDAFLNTIKSIIKNDPIFNDYTLEVNITNEFFEGTGDNYYDNFRDVIFSGYTSSPGPNNLANGRSSIESHKELESYTGINVISLEVKYPCFHIDTCLAPLPTGHILFYKDGITEEAYDKFLKLAFHDYGLNPEEYIIPITKNDALNNLATNLICIENKIVIPEFGSSEYPKLNANLINKLKDLGYKVFTHTFGQFIKVGGALHCTSHLLNYRVKGGIINRIKT